GFLLTMYDARTKLSGQVAAEVRGHFGPLCYATVIPRSVRLSEAPSFGEPVLTLDPSSRGSISYRLLAAEVEERYGLGQAPPPPPPPPAEPAVVPEASPRLRQTTPAPAVPGPGGRGYGVVTRIPAGLGDAWPPREPWS
ncbi:MAG TPA: ParA family protein, partial [Actinomycetota bacterium]